MAPISNLDKAVADRDSNSDILLLLETEITNDVHTPLEEPAIDSLLSLLKTVQVDIFEVHKRIQLCGPPDMTLHVTELGRLLTKSNIVLNGLTGIKNRFLPTSSSSSHTVGRTSQPEMRLPKLELPTFDGSLHQWVSFRDLFTNTIHNNSKLSKSEKLTYMKSLVKGDAARLIQTLVVTDANYDIAWSKLVDRYQNERELVFAIFDRFMNQPKVSANSASSIREVVDITLESTRSLEVFSITLDKGLDAFLLFLVFRKLDSNTRELWEQQLKDSKVPSLQILMEFLEQRARALASSSSLAVDQSSRQTHQSSRSSSGTQRSQSNANRNVAHHSSTITPVCKVCSVSPHGLYACQKFISLSVPERIEAVKRLRSCFNCLQETHSVSACLSTRTCRTCNGKHHTLIHRPRQAEPAATVPAAVGTVTHFVVTPEAEPSANTGDISSTEAVTNHALRSRQYDTVLATAVVSISDKLGHLHQRRVLTDGGSNTHYITESCVRQLQLRKQNCHSTSSGLGGAQIVVSKESTMVTVSPYFDPSIKFTMKMLVVPIITCKLPQVDVDNYQWSHLQGLKLADPAWHKSQSVDLLLGAEFFFAILEAGKRTGPTGSPVAINSSFGWLIGGGSRELISSDSYHFNSHNIESTEKSQNDEPNNDFCNEFLDQSIRKFWEVEDMPAVKVLSPSEQRCENHFIETHRRDPDGRFVVCIPWKSPRPKIGDSRKLAERRLLQLERRFEIQLSSGTNYYEEYKKFMHEYESMGHMELVPPEEIHCPKNPVYYIPHHYVLKESSTTSLRVVFNASAKSSTGVSLNDTMLVGPVVQDALMAILIRFRLNKIAFTADIAKMYRQVRVASADTDMQRILWRSHPDQPIREYRLLTVTYGTAAAPYLATRVLNEIAIQNSLSFPLGSKATLEGVYVDDLMYSVDEPEAVTCTQEFCQIMSRAVMEPRKWTSNSRKLLQSLPHNPEDNHSLMPIDKEDAVKALGIYWNPTRDRFQFKFSLPFEDKEHTKRTILSEMSKLFDPLGWLSPLIIRAKILLQKLWTLHVGWDDPLPDEIQVAWAEYKADMSNIDKIMLPRCMIPFKPTCVNLVGFADASVKAYAAVVYLCVYDNQNRPVISLITSKTRVAPIKQLSIPKLELCAAVLLAELMTSVSKMLKIPINNKYAWSDSTDTLHWINGHASRWKTFVANRVSKIQHNLEPSCWGHVPGEENPADCPSRGISQTELMHHSLWWSGPPWLSEVPFRKPNFNQTLLGFTGDSEEKQQPVTVFHAIQIDSSLISKYSSIHSLNRITCWMLRFVNNCRARAKPDLESKFVCRTIPLSPTELELAQRKWIKITQQQSFPEELQSLQTNKPLHHKNKLLSLSLFLDSNGVIRVGGRLRNANIPYDQKHPILLPRLSLITDLIITSAHKDNLHAGPQLLQSVLFQKYWIIRCRDAVKFHIRKCIICTRFAAKTQQQLMGNLPAPRVNQAIPFTNCGVDYAGPFLLRPIQPRSKVTIKCHFAIFICFSTRAIHIEIVSSMSTSAFQAALRRFVGRRGKPSNIFSDCGSNFIGASRELKEWLEIVSSDQFKEKVSNQLSIQGISWHFNPPSAPHFGGLWEAGVKSIKYHLSRIIGPQRLTFEEFTTIAIQIEACLNSRPLTAASTDPNDLSVLTPGHFLIGTSLLAVPEPNLTSLPENTLDRWQLVQQIQQHFWKRWSSEFLSRLQQRPKWMNIRADLQVGDMVLVKDDRLPPQKWQLGRILQLHPGSDNLVRVATVRVQSGDFKRPISKLCLLPIVSDSNSTIV